MDTPQLLELSGFCIALLGFMARFNHPPPRLVPFAPKGAKILDRAKPWVLVDKEHLFTQNLPPRSNTTFFRYHLYRLVYAISGGLLYLGLITAPEVSQQLADVVGLFKNELPEGVVAASPLATAFFVFMLLPIFPPFNVVDARIRGFLYTRAQIPAQQVRESNRLKNAPYNPPEKFLGKLKTHAKADGFSVSDFIYDPGKKDTRSLWTKSACLMACIEDWRANDHYQSAFDQLRDLSTHDKRCVELLREEFIPLRQEAQTFFSQQRNQNTVGSKNLGKQESIFRDLCKTYLSHAYCLLSRVSLHTHRSDRERVDRFRELGFHLDPHPSPLPDANDLVMLALLLGLIFILPLALITSVPKAMMIGLIIYSAILTPIVLLKLCPRLARRSNGHTPALAFPLLAGAVAALTGVLIQFGYVCVTGTGGDATCLQAVLTRIETQSYPWSIMHAAIAILLAWRIRLPRRPVKKTRVAWRRFRQWGDPREAAIFSGLLSVVFLLVVFPLLANLQTDIELLAVWPWPLRPFLIVALLGGVVGFLVPTWYRTQAKRPEERRRNLAARSHFDSQIQQWRNIA